VRGDFKGRRPTWFAKTTMHLDALLKKATSEVVPSNNCLRCADVDGLS
jgi:hypothetical protein